MSISPSSFPSAESLSTQAERKGFVLNELNNHPYRVPWWLRNSHAQTVWASRFRKVTPPPLRLERWDTPDGDFVRVHIHEGDPDKPLVLLLHGLEGSVRSNYIAGMNRKLLSEGWSVVTMEHRSCGGELNRCRQMYHSGWTGDLDYVIDRIVREKPDVRVYVVGYSLGANVTAKWLGESGDSLHENVRAAAAMSPPYNLLASQILIDGSIGRLYVGNFLKSLIPKALEKERQFPGCIDVELVKNSKTFRDFDTHATAKLHGFEHAEDYYDKVACGQFLDRIRRPTLLISSHDDPFNPGETIPVELVERSDYLHGLFTQKGGHVAHAGRSSSGGLTYWAEDQIFRFFDVYDRLFTESERVA